MTDVQLVLTTASIMTVMFGIVLLICLKIYGPPIRKYDGFMHVSETDTSQIHQLEIITPPEELRTQNRVVFKVRRES